MESSQSTASSKTHGGMGARGFVWTKTTQQFARSPFTLLLSRNHTFQSFVQLPSAKRGRVESAKPRQFLHLPLEKGPRWANGKWPWCDLFSLECKLQSSIVGSSSDTSGFFSTRKEMIFFFLKWKPRVFLIYFLPLKHFYTAHSMSGPDFCESRPSPLIRATFL